MATDERQARPTEKEVSRPYTWEELLSYDRLKRAVAGRVLERAEELLDNEITLKPERISQIVLEEWQRAKEAVRSSPAAREAFRKHLEKVVAEIIDGQIKIDKAELDAMGVAEKAL